SRRVRLTGSSLSLPSLPATDMRSFRPSVSRIDRKQPSKFVSKNCQNANSEEYSTGCFFRRRVANSVQVLMSHPSGNIWNGKARTVAMYWRRYPRTKDVNRASVFARQSGRGSDLLAFAQGNVA